MGEELKPCPFCGSGAPIVWIYRDKPHHVAAQHWNAHCKACNVVQSRATKAEAIAAWNTRA